MNVEIKTATARDLPAIAELAGLIWRAHYPGIISSEQIEYMLERMFDPPEMERQLAAGMVCEQLINRGRLAGFACHGRTGVEGEHKLDKLYVDPNFQRKGFGSRLLEHVTRSAASSGANTLILTVNKQNAIAIAAYKKNGFEIRESIVADIGNGFVMDDYVMSKDL